MSLRAGDGREVEDLQCQCGQCEQRQFVSLYSAEQWRPCPHVLMSSCPHVLMSSTALMGGGESKSRRCFTVGQCVWRSRSVSQCVSVCVRCKNSHL